MGWQATNHSRTMPLVHFCSFPCSSEQYLSVASYTRYLNHVPLLPQWALDWISGTMREWGLSPEEKKRLRLYHEFGKTGGGYSAIQSTKPSTIGYALSSSPLALLAYIGEKKLAWEDPDCFEMSDLLATVAIYFLTGTFASSVMIYQQSTKSVLKLIEPSRRGGIKSGVGYSVFVSRPRKLLPNVRFAETFCISRTGSPYTSLTISSHHRSTGSHNGASSSNFAVRLLPFLPSLHFQSDSSDLNATCSSPQGRPFPRRREPRCAREGSARLRGCKLGEGSSEVVHGGPAVIL